MGTYQNAYWIHFEGLPLAKPEIWREKKILLHRKSSDTEQRCINWN